MTAFQNLYTAAKAIVDDAAAAGGTALTLAPTNYGTNFRITPGAGLYQVQITPEKLWHRGNVAHPRAICSVFVHHYITTPANEVAFLHDTLNEVADRYLRATVWEAEAGIYSLQPDLDPTMDDGGREGNVITFEASASVLMDA